MISRLRIAFLYRWKRLASAAVRKRIARNVLELDRRDHVFISNNCIAGQLYEMAGLEKRSPTAGLFFRNGAYYEFLDAIAEGAAGTWSCLTPAMLRFDSALRCPVWDRGPNDALVFLHYADPVVAARKWTTRFPRLKDRKPVVIATLRDGTDRQQMEALRPRFDHFVIMEPSHGLIDNDGLDRYYLGKLNHFLEAVLDHVRKAD
jgi:uncharacterized protein (DUF1919 family)